MKSALNTVYKDTRAIVPPGYHRYPASGQAKINPDEKTCPSSSLHLQEGYDLFVVDIDAEGETDDEFQSLADTTTTSAVNMPLRWTPKRAAKAGFAWRRKGRDKRTIPVLHATTSEDGHMPRRALLFSEIVRCQIAGCEAQASLDGAFYRAHKTHRLRIRRASSATGEATVACEAETCQAVSYIGLNWVDSRCSTPKEDLPEKAHGPQGSDLYLTDADAEGETDYDDMPDAALVDAESAQESVGDSMQTDEAILRTVRGRPMRWNAGSAAAQGKAFKWSSKTKTGSVHCHSINSDWGHHSSRQMLKGRGTLSCIIKGCEATASLYGEKFFEDHCEHALRVASVGIVQSTMSLHCDFCEDRELVSVSWQAPSDTGRSGGTART